MQGHDHQQEHNKNNNNANRIKENKQSFQSCHRVFRPTTTSNQHTPSIVSSSGPSALQKHSLGLVDNMPYRKIVVCDQLRLLDHDDDCNSDKTTTTTATETPSKNNIGADAAAPPHRGTCGFIINRKKHEIFVT